VISKSDLIILVLASSALAVGIFRWHQNTQDVNAVTITASANAAATGTSRVVVEPVQDNSVPIFKTVDSLDNAAVNTSIQSNSDGQVVVQTTAQTEPVVIPEPKPVVEIVVATNDDTNLGTHQVQSGDYLGKIANQYGTDVQTLRELNNISGSIIQIGQKILYPL